MGVIHLAETRGPGGFEKLVVVKELKRELAEDPVYTAMFLDEARLAARLSHRHIVQTNEVGCEDGRYFMALELLEGGSLHQVRSKLGLRAMPVKLGVRALAAVLDALDHAHDLTDGEGRSLGVVHRDVSPQNVFLTYDGDVKLIDFGVAKSADRRGETKVGVVKGCVPYMSPDHVDGTSIDRRADVFAVGVILREMLTGERLWADADDMTILRALIKRELPVFPEAVDAPAALRAIVDRAMAPNRADRYQTAAAMRDAIEAYLGEVDPRGSLDDLGTWLGRALFAERARFRDIVRKSRAAVAATSPAITPAAASVAPPPKPATVPSAQVWLPSFDLKTRYSGPPVLPVAPPPLPAKVVEAQKQASRLRVLGASFVLVAAAAVALVMPSPAASGAAADGTSIGAAHARQPRGVDDSVTKSVITKPVTTAASDEDRDDTNERPSDVAMVMSLPAPNANIPAAVLRETVPPNPYD